MHWTNELALISHIDMTGHIHQPSPIRHVRELKASTARIEIQGRARERQPGQSMSTTLYSLIQAPGLSDNTHWSIEAKPSSNTQPPAPTDGEPGCRPEFGSGLGLGLGLGDDTRYRISQTM
jgi:hypothetical protein